MPSGPASVLASRVDSRGVGLAAEAGVTDVHLIAALALHRRMTEAELRHAVGDRVYDAFAPRGQLYNHDAEDPDGMTLIGETRHGEEVQISTRAAQSDLIVYVNINLVSMDGGWKSTATGLSGYQALRHHHNVHTMRRSRSFMDQGASELHKSNWRQGEVLRDAGIKVFQIETTVNNDLYGDGPMSVLAKREWEWSARDRATFLAARAGLDRLSPTNRRRILHGWRAPYAMTSVTAGEVEAVHRITTGHVYEQQLVPVEGQTDVLALGLPYICPYNVNSIMNPILVMCLGLGYFFNLYKGRPLVREGGAVPATIAVLHGRPRVGLGCLREDPSPRRGVLHRGDPLVEGQVLDGPVRRPVAQCVERLEAEQEPERSTGDLGTDRDATGVDLADEVEHLAPLVGLEIVLEERERERPSRLLGEADHPVHLALRRREVLPHHARGCELEHAGSRGGERAAEREQLVLRGERARHRLAVDGAVGDRARRRHAERAGLHALLRDAGHGRDVVGGGGLVARSAVAHHVATHCTVGHLRADVEHEGLRVEEVEEFGKGLPAPADALRQRGAGDVLHALHEADQPLVTVGCGRREAHTAVPHHHRGHPVPTRRGERRGGSR